MPEDPAISVSIASATFDAVPPILSAADYRKAVSAAFDPVRLQEITKFVLGGAPVLILTMGGLSDTMACAEPSDHVTTLMARIARAQGINPYGSNAPLVCSDPMHAKRTLEAVVERLTCLGSFANKVGGVVAVNDLGVSGLSSERVLGHLPSRTAMDCADWAALHELGHIAEPRQRVRVGYDDRETGNLPDLIRTKWLMHTQECFADAFAVAGMIALGRSEAETVGAYARSRAWTASLIPADTDTPRTIGFSREQATGIYCTTAAAAEAIELARCGMSPDDIMDAAYFAARRNRLTPQAILSVSATEVPETVSSSFLRPAVIAWATHLDAVDARNKAMVSARLAPSDFDGDNPLEAMLRLDAWRFALADCGMRLDPIWCQGIEADLVQRVKERLGLATADVRRPPPGGFGR